MNGGWGLHRGYFRQPTIYVSRDVGKLVFSPDVGRRVASCLGKVRACRVWDGEGEDALLLPKPSEGPEDASWWRVIAEGTVRKRSFRRDEAENQSEARDWGGGLKAANQSRGSFKGTADMKFSVAGDPRKSKRGARSLQRALMLNSSDNFAFVL